MKKIKIFFFIYRLGGGGAARTLLNIVNYIDKSKFDVTLVTLNFDYDYDQFVHEDVRFVKLRTNRLRSSIFELAKLLKKEKPDILFSTVLTYNIVAILAKLLSLTKTKVVVREAALLGGTSKKENFKLVVAGLLYKFANKVIALSYGVKDNLIHRYKVRENKIDVIYNPVDLVHINHEMKQPLTNEINTIIHSYDKVLVTAGRFVKEKDQHTLLRAFAKVKDINNSCLIVLGEGELEMSLKKEAKDLRIDDHVYFVGFQENPYAIFKQADLFVLTSTTEGFGHVLVEALATETLVVSTNCKPGAEEVLDNGKYGLLCEVGNVNDVAEKIAQAMRYCEEERQHVITLGVQRANEFHAAKVVSQYEAMFQQVKGVNNE